MDGSLGLIARMPALQVDWETLVSVNLPTLLLVIVAVPLALVGYIVGADVLVRRLPKRSQTSVRPWVWVGPGWCDGCRSAARRPFVPGCG